MLQIKQVKRYGAAQYPRGSYYRRPDRTALPYVRRGLAATGVVVSLQMTGCLFPMPGAMPVRSLSEADARPVIVRTFARQGISLTNDVLFIIQGKQLAVDGYNDSLKVGYEYVSAEDQNSFTSEIIKELAGTRYGVGPHIEILEPAPARMPQSELELAVLQFVDSLRAVGVI